MALTRCPHCNHLTREDRPVCLYCGGELPTVINSGVEPPQADIKQAPAQPQPPVPPAPPKPSVPQPPVPQPPFPQQAIPRPLPQQPVVQGTDTDQPSIAIVIICLLAGLLALGGGIALMLT